MNELIQTNAAALATKTGKNGSVRFSFVTRKAFGIAKSLKGAALKRAHDAYRLESARAIGGDFCKAIAEGRAFVTSLSHNAKNTGGSVHYVRDLKVVRVSREKELEDKIAALEAKLSAMGAAPAPAGA